MSTQRNLRAMAVLLALAAAACVRTVEVARQEVTQVGGDERIGSAANLPPSFRAVSPPAVEGDCPPRLIDPVLQARLYIVRALAVPVTDSLGSRLQAMGDYRVEPPGHYELLPGDGLRVDCTRLRAIGAVRLP